MKGRALQNILSANSAYATALGSDPNGGIKLYPSASVPQGAVRPYATYTLVSRPESQNKSGRGIYTANIQIDHYANTQDQAEELDDLCFIALNRYSGTEEGVKIMDVRGEGASDGFNEGQESYYRTTEFSFKIHP